VRTATIALTALLTTVSARAAEPDRAKFDEARSLIAEASIIERLQSASRVTETYAAGQREAIAKDLRNLAQEPGLGPYVRSALAALKRHDALALAALAEALVREEAALGRAP